MSEEDRRFHCSGTCVELGGTNETLLPVDRMPGSKVPGGFQTVGTPYSDGIKELRSTVPVFTGVIGQERGDE